MIKSWLVLPTADACFQCQFVKSLLQHDCSCGCLQRESVCLLGNCVLLHCVSIFALVQDFRGREPSTEPLLRHSGLIPASA